MPKYVVSSEGPISVKEIGGSGLSPEHPWVPGEPSPEHPWVPGWRPEFPGFPERPGHPIYPTLPPRDEWPALPPWLKPGVSLPIPPSPEHPMVPIPPGDGDGEEGIWPPIRPELPDLSGKSLALALIWVSRYKAKYAWVVIDHEEAKDKFEKVKDKIQAIKDKIPQPK